MVLYSIASRRDGFTKKASGELVSAMDWSLFNNEQVRPDTGAAIRSSNKEVEQWFDKIADFAEDLLKAMSF